MSGSSPRSITPEAPRIWRNWAGTVVRPVAKETVIGNRTPSHFSIESYNATTRALQGLTGLALHSNMPLRAVGSGWSFSAIAATEGVILNTSSLDYRITLDERQIDLALEGSPRNLILAQGGTTIQQLNTYLAGVGKSLAVTGASNGSTIAGAISTGLHGSAPNLGAIQDKVRALHLVVGHQRHVWLEPASAPIASSEFVGRLEAELIRDDDIFHAALVGLGSFGIIHGVVLEVEDLFWLRAARTRVPADDRLRHVIRTLDFWELQLPTGLPPHHFDVLGDPSTPDHAYLTIMERYAERPGQCLGTGSLWEPGYSRCAIELSETISGSGAVVEGSRRRSLSDIVRPYKGLCGIQGSVFRGTTARGSSVSSAIGVPLERAEEAMDVALPVLAEGEPGTLWQLRYVAPSRATLAFTHFAPCTCVLGLVGPGSPRTTEVFGRIWARLAESDIPHTYHWGTLHGLDASGVRNAYGAERIEAWLRARRAILPTSNLRTLFANEMLRTLGLAD